MKNQAVTPSFLFDLEDISADFVLFFLFITGKLKDEYRNGDTCLTLTKIVNNYGSTDCGDTA